MTEHLEMATVTLVQRSGIGTADLIYDRGGIGWFPIAAPCDMAVRTYQNQLPFVERGDRRIGNAD